MNRQGSEGGGQRAGENVLLEFRTHNVEKNKIRHVAIVARLKQTKKYLYKINLTDRKIKTS